MATSIPPRWRESVRRLFPELVEGVSFEFTSDVDFGYNCLSWALSISSVLLEDVPGGFWPWSHIPADTADGWVELCKIHGFTLRNDLNADFVAEFEKIAILEDTDGDLHACRQDETGKWKSKLGSMGPDIDHEGLACLEPAYGQVVRVLQRERKTQGSTFPIST